MISHPARTTCAAGTLALLLAGCGASGQPIPQQAPTRRPTGSIAVTGIRDHLIDPAARCGRAQRERNRELRPGRVIRYRQGMAVTVPLV